MKDQMLNISIRFPMAFLSEGCVNRDIGLTDERRLIVYIAKLTNCFVEFVNLSACLGNDKRRAGLSRLLVKLKKSLS